MATPMSPLRRRVAFSLLLAALCLEPVWAADTGADAQRQYERALASYAKRDFDTAAIELKNAIQADPAKLAPRVLLAKTYLVLGHAKEAEREIQVVAKQGADRSLTVPVLAKAYLFQFRERQLLDELTDDGLSDSARAEFLQVRGQALMNIGNTQAALEAFDAVEKLTPASAQPLIGKAIASLRLNDIDKAAGYAERAVQLEPGSADAWNTQASVLHAQGELEKALTLYDKAIGMSPELHDARIARVAIRLAQGKDALIADDLTYEAEHNPYDPRPAYLRAVRLARGDDAHGANSALAEANVLLENISSEAVNNNCQMLDLAGSVNYALGRIEQARDYYQVCLNSNPKLADVRKKLATTLLALREPSRVLEVLEDERSLGSNDPEILTLLANAWMAKGDADKATHLLQKAIGLSGKDNAARKTLAFHELYSGEAKKAEEALSVVLAAEPGDPQANLLMAVLHNQRGEHAKSIELLKPLLAKDPENVVLLNFIAVAESAMGERKAARAHLEKAIAKLPDFVPGIINLARLDVAEGALDVARNRLSEATKLYPGSPELLLELAHLLADSGNRDAAITLLDYGRKFADAPNDVASANGAKVEKSSPKPASGKSSDEKGEVHSTQAGAVAEFLDVRCYLAELLLAANRQDEARSLIADIEEQAPDDLRGHELRVRAALKAGKRGSLRSSLKKMSDMAGFDPAWLLRISTLQRQIGSPEDAQYSLSKADRGHPDNLAVLVALTSLAIEQNKVDSAELYLKRLLAKWPDEIMSHRLAGDLALQRGKGDVAAESYQKILEQKPSLEAVELVSRAWGVAGYGEKAIKTVDTWTAAHPEDVAARKLLAEIYLAEKSPLKAREIYEALVAEQPNDANCLNNVAYLAEITAADGAVDYARRAHAAAPGDPNINDTLGWILVRHGRAEEGLQYLREADTLLADSSVIKFHLAQALVALEQEAEARAALQDALRSGNPFDGIDEARALLAKLGPN